MVDAMQYAQSHADTLDHETSDTDLPPEADTSAAQLHKYKQQHVRCKHVRPVLFHLTLQINMVKNPFTQ